MNSLLINVILETSIVSAILIASYTLNGEAKAAIDGPASLLMAFGIMWAIGSFLRLSKDNVSWATSVCLAIWVTFIGAFLATQGIFTALGIFGLGILVITSKFRNFLSLKTRLSALATGIVLISMWFMLNDFEKPMPPDPIKTKSNAELKVV